MTQNRLRPHLLLLCALAVLAAGCGSTEDAAPNTITTTPTTTTAQPQTSTSQPGTTTAQPQTSTSQPGTTTTARPATTTTQPATTTTAPTFDEGDTIPGFPTGNDAIPGVISNMSIQVNQGRAVFDMGHSASLEYDDATYTCTSVDGCGIEGQLVTRGSIVSGPPSSGDEDNSDDPSDTTTTSTTAPTTSTTTTSTTSPPTTTTTTTSTTSTTTTSTTSPPTTTTSPPTTTTTTTTTTTVPPNGDCYVGLVVSPGGRCTYVGTAEDFWVDDSGRGHFAFFTAGTGISARNTNINGVLYNFAASKQDDGTWLIEAAG